MHTEWWNEPEMSEDERALERREHQLRAMNNGHVIQIMPGSKAEMRAQLDWFLYGPPPEFCEDFGDPDPAPLAGYFLTDEQIDHLLEHGYIPGKDIALSTEPLIDDNNILLRPSLMKEFIGYTDERDTPTKPSD